MSVRLLGRVRALLGIAFLIAISLALEAGQRWGH
jgi:hypothetical protein